MDPRHPQAQALAVRDGRVVALDDAARAVQGPTTRVVDLAGDVALPGFIDAHTHLPEYGVWLSQLDLGDVPDLEGLLAELAPCAGGAGWLVGRAWDESRWPQGRAPTRQDLDRVIPHRPVLLLRVDMHSGVANTAGLQALGWSAERVPEGRLTEEALDRAYRQVQPVADERVAALQWAVAACHRAGVTAVHSTVAAEDVDVLGRAHQAGWLGVRTRVYVGALSDGRATGPAVAGDEWLQVQGIKLFLDGSVGARTAAFTRSYADRPGEYGRLLYDDRVLTRLLGQAADANQQPALHCIGDAAVDQALAALTDAGVPPQLRPRLEHVEFWRAEALDAMRARGVVASCQPNFVGQWGRPGGLYEQRRGACGGGCHNAYRDLLGAGVALAFGSDHMPFGPAYGLHWAVNHPDASQRLSVSEALYAYTAGAAYAGFQEADLGVLRPGAHADLVVVRPDPLEHPAELEGLEIALTVSAGWAVYDPDARCPCR